MSLATDLLRARNKKLKDELTEKMGDKEGARVFEAITETPLVLLDTATILAGWDNCKTVYENMANILGDILQDAIIETSISKKIPNDYISAIVENAMSEILDTIGIDLGSQTEFLFNKATDIYNYFKRIENAEAEFEKIYNNRTENGQYEFYDDRYGLVKKGLPSWNYMVNDTRAKLEQEYKNSVRKLAPYSQIPLDRLEDFAKNHGVSIDDLIKTNNLLKTENNLYALVPENGKLTLPNGEFAVLPFVCDTKTNQQIKTQNSQNLSFSNSDKNDKFTNLQNLQNGNFSNSQTSCHSERSEESKKNLQNVNSQNSQNTPKEELTFNEKYVIKDFAYKLYGVKMPETKQRIGIDAMTQHKISFLLDTICEHKRQIVRNFGEKTWQETFENFQKTNDLKVFENAVKSQIPNENANLQIPNENANLKNSENNITNPQENGNDFKM